MTDQTRDIVERVARAICAERNARISDCLLGCTKDTGCLATGFDESDAEYRYAQAAIEAAGIEALTKRVADLEGDWFDKAIRDHEAEHGPSGSDWNISMVLERLHRARAALSNAARGEEG
jgi:hypothetical protein